MIFSTRVLLSNKINRSVKYWIKIIKYPRRTVQLVFWNLFSTRIILVKAPISSRAFMRVIWFVIDLPLTDVLHGNRFALDTNKTDRSYRKTLRLRGKYKIAKIGASRQKVTSHYDANIDWRRARSCFTKFNIIIIIFYYSTVIMEQRAF